ncbi:unnamed protein product, partial [Effrenium voratum]
APDGARPPSPSATSRRKLRIGPGPRGLEASLAEVLSGETHMRPWKRNDEVTRKKNA